MLAPLRRCVDGWPCMVGDLRGRKMRTGSKIENLSTTRHGESRELQLLLFNFSCRNPRPGAGATVHLVKVNAER